METRNSWEVVKENYKVYYFKLWGKTVFLKSSFIWWLAHNDSELIENISDDHIGGSWPVYPTYLK